jgi:hypothetical protein
MTSAIKETDREKFERLKKEWEDSTTTKFSSSMNDICTQASYQTIIGMGEKAIPFIIEDWQTTNNHWFWALRCITEADPVPVEDRGKIAKMKEHWLKYLGNA